MKRFLYTIVFCLLNMSPALAEPMYFLFGKDNINVQFDFSNAVVEGMSVRDFQDLSKVAELMWVRLFLDELNDEVDGDKLHFGEYPESSFTLLCNVISISANGSTQLDVRFVDTDTLEERKKLKIYGRGGIFGSFANLIGDAMQRCGETLGEEIHRGLRL